MRACVCAGLPASLHVQPTTVIEVENGNAASFEVEVHDLAGNISCQQKSVITCTVRVNCQPSTVNRQLSHSFGARIVVRAKLRIFTTLMLADVNLARTTIRALYTSGETDYTQ